MATNNAPPELIAELTRRGLLKDGKLVNSSPAPAVSTSAQLLENFANGLLQKPGYAPSSGFLNKAAYYGGELGPSVLGATIGSMAPGAGTALGAALGAGAGAAMGRSLQNLGQTVSNQITPGSAEIKSPATIALEPTTEALAQGLAAGAGTGAINALKSPLTRFIGATTGVKPNLVERAINNIGTVMSSDSVQKAGEEIGAIAGKAGIKTGSDGYKLATASMLGKDAATDEWSPATTFQMAKLAREVGPEALTPQEMYSTAEMLRKGLSAPKFSDPHGQFSSNFRLYATQLAGLEDKLETIIPGYDSARANYANSIAKEAFGNFSPLNKNLSVSQIKTMAQMGLVGSGLAAGGTGHEGGAGEFLLSAALLSPLISGRLIQAGSAAMATQIPQMLGRTALSAGSNTLADSLSATNPPLQSSMGGQSQ